MSIRLHERMGKKIEFKKQTSYTLTLWKGGDCPKIYNNSSKEEKFEIEHQFKKGDKLRLKINREKQNCTLKING